MKLKKLLAILIALLGACVLMVCSVSAAGAGTVTLSYAYNAQGTINSPDCMIGRYMIAAVSDLPEDVTGLKYEFKMGGDVRQNTEVVPTDANFLKAVYQPVIADAGETITVTVTVYQDNSSYALSPVTSATVVPAMPTFSILTANGFTISNFNSAYDYAIIKSGSGTILTEDKWQTLNSGVITGLEEDTVYNVYARVRSKPAAVSRPGSATTFKAPKVGDFSYSTTSAAYTGGENRATVTSTEHDGYFRLEYVQNGSTVTPKNAGVYQLYAIVQMHGRYADDRVSLGTWTINKCPVSITPTVQEKIFNNSAAATILPGALTGAVAGDDVSVAENSLAGAFQSKFVGNDINVITSSDFHLTGAAAGNYTLNQGILHTSLTGNIKPAPHTITLPDTTPHIYQNDPATDISAWASSHVSGAQLTYSLVDSPTGITLTTVDGKPMLSASSAVGTAASFSVKVTAAAKDMGGDSTPEYSETTETFTVTAGKRNPGLTITGDTAKTYGDAPFTVEANLGVADPTSGSGTWLWITDKPGVLAIEGTAAAASARVKVAGAGSAKLTVTYISDTYAGTAETTISVGKKTVTVGVGTYSITKEYDGTTSPGTGSGALAVGGILDSDSGSVTVTAANDSYLNESVQNTNMIGAALALAGERSGNYQLAADHIYQIPCFITPKEITITAATAENRAYVEGSKAVTITGVTFSDVVSSDAPLRNYTAAGEMTNDTAGDGKAVTVTVTLRGHAANNYTLASRTCQTTVNISKAQPAAPTDLRGQQGEALSTVTLPANWSWDAGSTTMTVGTHTYTASYTETANYLARNGVRLTVEVQPTNIDANVTLADGTLVYTGSGLTYEMAAVVGYSGGSWTYTYTPLPGTGSLNGDNQPLTAGSYTVVATYENDAHTHRGTASAALTVEKATPGGAPSYAAITESGKTLADAHLTAGTITPDGTIAWNLDESTAVEANTAYGWTFTPTDSTNYRTLTGSAVLYPRSGGSSSNSYAVIVEKTANGSLTVSSTSARKGSTVTITAVPDSGCALETLKVLDQKGQEIPVTAKNGKYTFTMPGGKVTVKGTFAEEAALRNFFVDVPANAYYYEAVLWAAKNGITGGVDATHFAPNAPCTRAQIVTFLWRAAGSPEPKSLRSFEDVPADAYYAKAVAWAAENGIAGGWNGKFSPNAPCTRAQGVTFLYRAAGSPATGSGASFSDVEESAYYAKAVAWAKQRGITGGRNGIFDTTSVCTRAHIVTFLYRSMGK